VHLEARALVDRVVARLAQAERGVEHVLPTAGSALAAVLAGVVDDQHRDAAPAQPQQPVLDLRPGVAVVLAHADGQAREVVEDQ
jgi:hypothetical protein